MVEERETLFAVSLLLMADRQHEQGHGVPVRRQAPDGRRAPSQEGFAAVMRVCGSGLPRLGNSGPQLCTVVLHRGLERVVALVKEAPH